MSVLQFIRFLWDVPIPWKTLGIAHSFIEDVVPLENRAPLSPNFSCVPHLEGGATDVTSGVKLAFCRC